MSAKHTPGPWAQNGTQIESEHEHGWANDGWILGGCEGPDAAANARLMAAGPDLLDAATYALDVLNQARGKHDRLRAIQRLQAAIAKATGGEA